MGNVYSEANKQIVTIDDAKLWRSHSVTLSDNGEWYTLLYSLTEKLFQAQVKKPAQKDAENKDDEKKDMALYGKKALTDVLYIRHTKSKKEYAVRHGSKPLFSSTSEWIAYSIKPGSGNDDEKSGKKNDKKDAEKDSKKIIELRNLKTGETRRWESNASYIFTEDGSYFVSSDKTSLLLYNLSTLKEYYIGNIGEYLLDKKSDLVVYTIRSGDKRGNGIYTYDLKTYITRALETGNFDYSNVSWNKDRTAIAALKYKDEGKEKDPADMRIITIMEVDADHANVIEYKPGDISGMPDDMRLAVKNDRGSSKITWSGDNERLFLSIKKKSPEAPGKKKKSGDSPAEEASVNVWHWKDKKLVSQQMVEAKKEKNKGFKIVFERISKKAIRLTGDEIQRIYRSPGTDKWAAGTDDRSYISDWDVPKYDFYRINLSTGERTLIIKEQPGEMHISPDGEKAIYWRDSHYWYYHFENHSRQNITANVPVSFIDREYDEYGSNPAYGFVGWVKDPDSVIVNHKLDLWQLPLDGKSKAINLTESVTQKEPIRFRFDDMSFLKKPEPEERYIDLSTPLIVSAFNIKTKYSGYYRLSGNGLKKLIYKPAYFTNSRWWRWVSALIKAKESAAIIFRQSSYEKCPESFLSDTGFSKPKKITTTNPQQSKYKWGHRVLIDYTNDDGVPLQGVLSIPDDYKKGQRLPMIVYSYEKLSDNLFRYANPYISGHSVCEMMYVSNGYLFLQPDIHFNIGTPHSDMHECIDAAVGKVIELGYVDEKRIGYQGFSFGGHCGMFISTRDNKFAAIAAGAGVSNLVQGFNIDIVHDGSNEQDYYITSQGRLGTDPTSDLDMYTRESAVFNAQNMNTPLLLYHGTADEIVQWEHSFGLYSILRFLKKPVIFLSYRGEGHGLRQKANRIDIQTRLKEFFDYYLKGEKAPGWMVDGVPYREPEKKKTKEKEQRTLPPWKATTWPGV